VIERGHIPDQEKLGGVAKRQIEKWCEFAWDVEKIGYHAQDERPALRGGIGTADLFHDLAHPHAQPLVTSLPLFEQFDAAGESASLDALVCEVSFEVFDVSGELVALFFESGEMSTRVGEHLLQVLFGLDEIIEDPVDLSEMLDGLGAAGSKPVPPKLQIVEAGTPGDDIVLQA
jgi:hypothetical protein